MNKIAKLYTLTGLMFILAGIVSLLGVLTSPTSLMYGVVCVALAILMYFTSILMSIKAGRMLRKKGDK